MKNMSNLANRYKKDRKNPGAAKNANKNSKKSINNALNQALKLAVDNQVAVVIHDGIKYIMVSEEKLRGAIKNLQTTGHFTFDLTPELKEFSDRQQKLHQAMGSLTYEIQGRDKFGSDEEYQSHIKIMQRNSKLFDELDQFTFEFSQGYSDGKSKRKDVNNRFDKYWEENPILNDIIKGKIQHTGS